MGNFDPRQGTEVLIDAMATVHERFPNAILLLVGGEPHQIGALQRRAADLGLANSIRMVGKRPVEQMPEFMALATVLASPRLEPHVTPLKIYNYMASGRPIVATDLPTHTDVLDRNAAILVPPTADGLARGIMQVLDNPAEGDRLGQRARYKSERDHTYVAFKGQVRGVYSYLESQNRREGKNMSST
jgi:glycosyltransferase involved in cell wall biosynthesis